MMKSATVASGPTLAAPLLPVAAAARSDDHDDQKKRRTTMRSSWLSKCIDWIYPKTDTSVEDELLRLGIIFLMYGIVSLFTKEVMPHYMVAVLCFIHSIYFLLSHNVHKNRRKNNKEAKLLQQQQQQQQQQQMLYNRPNNVKENYYSYKVLEGKAASSALLKLEAKYKKDSEVWEKSVNELKAQYQAYWEMWEKEMKESKAKYQSYYEMWGKRGDVKVVVE